MRCLNFNVYPRAAGNALAFKAVGDIVPFTAPGAGRLPGQLARAL